MKKLTIKSLILVFVTLICTSCNCSKKENITTYKTFYDTDVSTFNYMITNEYQDLVMIANLVDGLVENDKYGNIVPSIAKSWKSEIINGKQVWTFYLKDNVYWSDYKGNKYGLVTAHDFVTTLKYSLNYTSESNNYNFATSLIDNALNYYNYTLMQNYDIEEINSKVNTLVDNNQSSEFTFYKRIKDVFDYCDTNNSCTSNFENVGVKAINDFELQYTLSTPSPYFLSALTYCTFLPTNETFIKEIGFNNFGTSKKALLYNGAYILSDFSHSSKMEYVKNQNYWDKNNVFIDKLIFTKSLNYHLANYSRLAYESNNIDEFILDKNDTKGWEKYVTGSNNEGSEDFPIGPNTYINDNITNFTTYYLVFNQNRTHSDLTTLSEKELQISNMALSNNNFRKALFYGLNKDIFNNSSNTSVSSIVPSGFISLNGIDYNQYFINTYASKNNLTYEQAAYELDNSTYLDEDKSSEYLKLAIEQLNIKDADLPIKIEYTYYYDDEFVQYYKLKIDEWNRTLNNCTSEDCNYNKVEIVYNSAIESIVDYNTAFMNKEYGITFVGIYPDFNDPYAFLSAFGTNGEIYPYTNHQNSNLIQEMLDNANQYYEDEDIEKRYQLYSELEYYILFEENILIPLFLSDCDKQIIVSNLLPYQKMKASYGLSPFKFKFRKITSTPLTKKEIKDLKEEYEKGKKKS